MTAIDEKQLNEWTHRAYRDEDRRALATERAIRQALARHPLLCRLDLTVYSKGSYKNNTNVRRDSDVDIGIECREVLTLGFEPGVDQSAVWSRHGLVPYAGALRDQYGNFDARIFKAAVEAALVDAFGSETVTRSDKVFTLAGAAGTPSADIVPCVPYRHHSSVERFSAGVQLLPDKPRLQPLFNFPRQHLFNGVAKNTATARRFKRVVRILKNLENQMVAEAITAPLASYLIESLVYNAPNRCFAAPTWRERVRDVLFHVWEDTGDPGCEGRWLEVNGLKYLFHRRQRWSRDSARAFVAAAWPFVEAG
jgi:hypothetical protein